MPDMANRAGSMPASSLTSDDIRRVPPDASLRVVAQVMSDSDVGLLVVGSGDEVAGVVSERDLVRAIAAERDPLTTCASDIAHGEIAWCDLTATVSEVATEMMEQYVRHVLVEDAGRLVGVISARDLLGVYTAGDDPGA